MARLGFIEIHKRILDRTGKPVEGANPTIINVTSIQSVVKYDDHTIIELVGRDCKMFAVAEPYEQVVQMLSNAGGKVNRIADSQEVARG